MMKKKNNTNKASVLVGANIKVNPFIVKYIYEDAYAHGYSVGVAYGTVITGFGNHNNLIAVKYNSMLVKNCNISIKDLRYYLMENNIVSPSYFDSIKTNLFNACMLGIVNGDQEHSYK